MLRDKLHECPDVFTLFRLGEGNNFRPIRKSPALEAFIDETIKLAKERGYNPTTFQAKLEGHSST